MKKILLNLDLQTVPKFGIPIKFVTLKSERRISQVSFVFFSMTHQRTTDTAQNNIPIPNKKSCKMYENLSILQKKWLTNGKSRTRDTHGDKIWADSTTKNTLKYLKTYSAHLPNRSKYLGYLKKGFHWVFVVRGRIHPDLTA